MELELAELYVTTLGRAPDAQGFDFWLQATRTGVTIDEIRSNWFSSEVEVINRFDGLSNEDFIGLSYLNAFGRLPDDEGVLYWDALLDDGTLARESFNQALVLGAQAATGSPSDVIALSNRTEVGLLFAKLDGVSDTPATDIVKLVTSDESTLMLAESVLALISATRNEHESRDEFSFVNDVIAAVFFNTLVSPVKTQAITEYLAFVSESVALNPTPAVSTVFLATAYALNDFENNLLKFGGVENLARDTTYSLRNQGVTDSDLIDSGLRPPLVLPITDSQSPTLEISNQTGNNRNQILYFYYIPEYYYTPPVYERPICYWGCEQSSRPSDGPGGAVATSQSAASILG